MGAVIIMSMAISKKFTILLLQQSPFAAANKSLVVLASLKWGYVMIILHDIAITMCRETWTDAGAVKIMTRTVGMIWS